MKKCIVGVLLAIAFSLMFTCAFATVDSTAAWQNQLLLFNRIVNDKEKTVRKPSEAVIKLPVSLLVIEDEAFEGTAFVSVDLPDMIESIGDYAFANIPTLLSVKIPENTKEISKTAFAGSNNVTLTGLPGSYARTWARENGIPFAPIAAMHAGAGTVQTFAAHYSDYEQVGLEEANSAECAQKRPLWRYSNENQSERYDKWFVNQISGRAPPTDA